MTILKKAQKAKKFTCKNCGREFEAALDEYWVDHSETLTSYPPQFKAYCNCPECHKIVTGYIRTEVVNGVVLGSVNVLDSSTIDKSYVNIKGEKKYE